jgi:outer membrane receptor protein involved in Fe transport
MISKRFISGLLALCLLCTFTAVSAHGQSLVSGDVTGTVSDPTGAVVPNASITLKSVATGETRTASSNASGSYRFSLLRPGNYALSASATGFSKSESTVTVNLGQATIANLELKVGTSAQVIEVSGEAPLVNADNADLSTSFDTNIIANEPNGGNDLTYVAQTAPGVVMNTGMGLGNFSSNGLPGTANLFTVNGENDMDPYLNLNNSGATNLTLGRNELQESTVVSNPYSGQYGQQAGAQVSYVTKSGSNQFHGNAIYWWTGRAMDANDWFNNNSTPVTPRPFANNNEWAASIGGPIQKDKTFFFADYEGIRYIVPSTTPVYAFSPNFAADTLANLSKSDPAAIPNYTKLFSLYEGAPGYANGKPFAGNCADYTGPASTIGANGDCIRQFEGSPSLPGTEYILSGRVDHNFSDNDKVFFRVRMDHGTQATSADPINSAFSAASYQPAYDGQSQWNHVFSSNATNQFIMAGSYYRAIFTQENAKATFPFSVEGDAFNLTTLGNASFAFPEGRNVTQYQLIDDFSDIRGNHSLKFGANFRRYDISDFVFSEYNTPRVISLSLADFSVGQADEYIQRFPQGGKLAQPVALWGLGLYGQDEWKVSRNLKLTFGLRAEHNSNPVCQTDCAALPVQPIQSLSSALNVSTPYNQIIQGGRQQIFRSMDAINFSPRLGFAWSPIGQSTVIRGGIGMFYDALPGAIGDQFMLNVPQVLSFTLINGAPLTLNWADPTSAGAPALAAASASALASGFSKGLNFTQLSAQVPGFARPTLRDATDFQTPQFQEWSFGIDQALGQKTSFSAMYVGNHGIHIPIFNEGLNAHIAGLSPIPATRTYPMFGTVEQYNTDAVSNYNGLVTSFKRRLTYGFDVQASYTYSHAFDEVSNGGLLASNAISSLVFQMNPFNLRQNYGPADYDIRHNFSATYVWTTPWKFGNSIVNGAIGGWTLSENFFVHSGLPFTVLDGTTSISNLNTTNTPPAQVIAANGQESCVNGHSTCLNTAAFEPASAFGAFPTQHRNGFRGPGFFDSDFNINKNFKITEKLTFGFGANFYNVFNHPNFANPDSNLADSNFGMITQTTAPPTGPYGSFFTGLPSGRIIQFQGKLVF